MMNRRRLMPYSVAALVCLALSTPVSAGGNLVANRRFETGSLRIGPSPGTPRTLTLKRRFVVLAHTVEVSSPFWDPSRKDFCLRKSQRRQANRIRLVGSWAAKVAGPPNDFSAYWNGTSIFAVTNIPDTSGVYTQYSFTEVANGPTTTIQFGYSNPPGFQALDDISVTQSSVPEPSSLALAGIGILAFAGYAARRRMAAHEHSSRAGSDQVPSFCRLITCQPAGSDQVTGLFADRMRIRKEKHFTGTFHPPDPG